MQIRIRETSEVMLWSEFRNLLLAQNPSELITVAPQTEEWLNAKGADVVFEGPQATGGTVYQYSQRDGVEEIEGQWFTKYVLGPIFTDTTVDGVTTTAAEHEAAYIAMKDAEFKSANAARAKALLLETDWSENASVRNTSVTPHLTNSADFDAYRLALRAIVVDPPIDVETWPTKPQGIWI